MIVPILLALGVLRGGAQFCTKYKGDDFCRSQGEWAPGYVSFGSGKVPTISTEIGKVVWYSPGRVEESAAETRYCGHPGKFVNARGKGTDRWGDTIPDELKPHMWKMGMGMIGDGKDEDYTEVVYMCVVSPCPDLGPHHFGKRVILDFENTGLFTQAWWDKNKQYLQEGKCVVYVNQMSNELDKVEKKCELLFNGYDGAKSCHIKGDYTASQLDRWEGINYIAGAAYGWTATDQCFGWYRNSSLPVKSIPGCKETEDGCKFPSLTQTAVYHKNALMKESVGGVKFWGGRRSDPSNKNWEGIWKDYIKVAYRDFALDASFSWVNSTCKKLQSKGGEYWGAPKWIRGISAPTGVGCDVGVGNIAERLSGFQCTGPVVYEVCEHMVCAKPVPSNPMPWAPCMSAYGGTWVKVNVEAATTTGGRQCTGGGGLLFCHSEQVTELCTPVCRPFTCLAGLPYQFSAQGEFLEVKQGLFSQPAAKRARRSVRSGSTLQPKGQVMIVNAERPDQYQSCCVIAESGSSCKNCGPVELCSWEISLEFARNGEVVTVSCGGDPEKILWKSGVFMGYSTGIRKLDNAVREFGEYGGWYQFMIIVSILYFIQLIYKVTMAKLIVKAIKSTVVMTVKGAWDFPSFLRLCFRSWAWGLMRRRVCRECCSDVRYVKHGPNGECPYKGDKCRFELNGSECLETKGYHHWVTCHLPDQVVPGVFWGCIWNWIFYWKSVKRVKRDMEDESGTKRVVRRGKGLPSYLTLAVCLALMTRADAVNNLISSSVCLGTVCEVQTMIEQVEISYGGTDCYSFQDKTLPGFCLTVLDGGMSAHGTIVRCQTEIYFENLGRVYCADQAGCANQAISQFEKEGCPVAYRHEEKSMGGWEIGCGLINQNSMCVKAIAHGRGSGWCHVRVEEWAAYPVACVVTDKGQVCTRPGTAIEVQGLTFDFQVDVVASSAVPKDLMLKEGKQVRTVTNDEGGCFDASTSVRQGGRCESLKVQTKCHHVINYWNWVDIWCEMPRVLNCESPADFPPFQKVEGEQGCRIDTWRWNDDKKSAYIEATKCSSAITMMKVKIKGTVQREEEGAVTGIEVRGCQGVSGTNMGTRCEVTILCNGQTSCRMSQPVQRDMVCGETTTIVFTATKEDSEEFECGGKKTTAKLDLSIVQVGIESAIIGQASNSIESLTGLKPWELGLAVGGALFGVIVAAIIIGVVMCKAKARRSSKRED